MLHHSFSQAYNFFPCHIIAIQSITNALSKENTHCSVECKHSSTSAIKHLGLFDSPALNPFLYSNNVLFVQTLMRFLLRFRPCAVRRSHLSTPFIVISIKVPRASIPEISERGRDRGGGGGGDTEHAHNPIINKHTHTQKVGCARFYLYGSGNCLEQEREPIKDTHTHTHTHTGTQTSHIHTHARTSVRTHMNRCIYAIAHTNFTHTHTQTRMHTHTHTHTHPRRLTDSW